MGVMSLKDINGDLGRVKLVNTNKYSHLLVFKYSQSERSLTRMYCVVLMWEMLITSYGLVLRRPSGSWIVGVVSSQLTVSKPHRGCELLANGKPMVLNFPHWKDGQFGCMLFSSSAEGSRTKCERRKKAKRETEDIPKFPIH